MKNGTLSKLYDGLTYIPWNQIATSIRSLVPQYWLQYIWLLSHSLTLFGMIMYSAYLISPTTEILYEVPWYLISLVGSIVTYSVVVYRRHILDPTLMIPSPAPAPPPPPPSQSKSQQVRQQQQSFQMQYSPVCNYDGMPANEPMSNNVQIIPLTEMLKSENTHLLVYASLWLSTPPSILKVFPFASYSFLNIMNFLIMETYPENQLSIAITPLISYIEYPMLLTSAHIDLLNIILLMKESYEFKSLYALIFYSFIWGLRVEYSDASRIAVSNILKVFDKLFIDTIFPSSISAVWINLRNQLILILSISSDEIINENEEEDELESDEKMTQDQFLKKAQNYEISNKVEGKDMVIHDELKGKLNHLKSSHERKKRPRRKRVAPLPTPIDS